MGATRKPKCGTVGCKRTATEEISYRYRGDDERDVDQVCTPCADGYERRVVCTHFTRKLLPFRTLEEAARAYGAANGVTGGPGGWLYRNCTHLCHGWRDYGFRLVSAGVIDPQDENGRSVRRIGHLLTASERQWRLNARRYVITGR